MSTTDPNSKTVSVVYDAASQVIQRTDARSLVTKYFYDAVGQGIRVEHWNASFTVLIDQVTYQYDEMGNRTQMVDTAGTTTYQYDALDRPTSVTFPGNKTASYLYNNQGARSRTTYPDSKYVDYGYDAAGNATSVTDWASRQTTFTYDNDGKLITTNFPAETGLVTTRSYDAADRLTEIDNARVGVPNAMLVASIAIASSTTWTPPSGMTEDYDKKSKGSSNAAGVSIEVSHVTMADPGATGQKTATAASNADTGAAHLLALRPAAGQSITMASKNSNSVDGSTSLQITRPSSTSAGNLLLASIAVTPYTAAITPPSGWSLVSRVDSPSGGLSAVAVYRKIAGSSEPSSYTWTFSTSVGAAGGILRFTGVDNANPIISHDGDPTPSSLSHSTPNINTPTSADIATFTYTLNAVGNRTQMVGPNGTTTFTYDDLYRLTAVDYPTGTDETFTYDANGNRLTKNSTSYTYDDADQLTAAGGVSYGYDFNGNLTSRGSDSFTWDHENRMTAATISATSASYAYNGDGLRMSRTIGSQTNTYIWDIVGLPVILQDTTGSTTTTYVYGPTGMLYWVDQAGNPTYRLTDGLGSTVALCDANGNVTDSWTYGAFGDVRSHTGTSGTDFTFTGEQNDPNGLEYLRARYYDPATGRFLSRDPLGGGYPYAGNNPVSMLDPTGLCEWGPWTWGDCVVDAVEFGAEVSSDLGEAFAEAVTDLYDFAASGGNEVADVVASGVAYATETIDDAWYYGVEFAAEVPYGVYYASYEILGTDIPYTDVDVCWLGGLAVCGGLVVAEAVGAYTHAAMDQLAGHSVDTDGDIDSLTNPFYHGQESGCWFPCVDTPGFNPGWTWSDPFEGLDFNWP